MKKKAILFDLDGTLLDTSAEFILCVNLLRARYALPPLPNEVIRTGISGGARGLTRLALSLTDSDPLLDARLTELLSLYRENLGSQTLLFPGMSETLTWIEQQGLAWGIVTNKVSIYTLGLLKRLALPFTPASVVCPDQVTHTKPHPEPLLLACTQIGCSVEEAVYFGDHPRDIDAARACGMFSVSCGWGYIEAGEDCLSWKADLHLASPFAIPAFLRDFP
jgi:2-phosphoglycolate phosphatase